MHVACTGVIITRKIPEHVTIHWMCGQCGKNQFTFDNPKSKSTAKKPMKTTKSTRSTSTKRNMDNTASSHPSKSASTISTTTNLNIPLQPSKSYDIDKTPQPKCWKCRAEGKDSYYCRVLANHTEGTWNSKTEKVCCVCGQDDSVDMLIQCCDCHIYVHKHCYGVGDKKDSSKKSKSGNKYVPMRDKFGRFYRAEDQDESMSGSESKEDKQENEETKKENDYSEWKCDYCISHPSSNKRRCCCLCPKFGGALKCIDIQKDLWCHVVCLLWIPECRFGNVATLSNVYVL